MLTHQATLHIISNRKQEEDLRPTKARAGNISKNNAVAEVGIKHHVPRAYYQFFTFRRFSCLRRFAFWPACVSCWTYFSKRLFFQPRASTSTPFHTLSRADRVRTHSFIYIYICTYIYIYIYIYLYV